MDTCRLACIRSCRRPFFSSFTIKHGSGSSKVIAKEFRKNLFMDSFTWLATFTILKTQNCDIFSTFLPIFFCHTSQLALTFQVIDLAVMGKRIGLMNS